ncbi:hypothetical protein GOODEAATRI_010044 [Goodea atripinnis]|uniref:Uncharacterized protein n=1 Tax=Goodea atripinnis TaxID=208336 RepID=A0ABV0PWR3_9TELE
MPGPNPPFLPYRYCLCVPLNPSPSTQAHLTQLDASPFYPTHTYIHSPRASMSTRKSTSQIPPLNFNKAALQQLKCICTSVRFLPLMAINDRGEQGGGLG